MLTQAQIQDPALLPDPAELPRCASHTSIVLRLEPDVIHTIDLVCVETGRVHRLLVKMDDLGRMWMAQIGEKLPAYLLKKAEPADPSTPNTGGSSDAGTDTPSA